MVRMPPSTDQLFNYVTRIGTREHPALRHCREETAKLAEAEMQIGPD